MPPKALLFDFDDTLSDEAESLRVAVQNSNQRVVPEFLPDTDTVLSALRRLSDKEWQRSSMRPRGRQIGVSPWEVFCGGFQEDPGEPGFRSEGDRIRPLIWRQIMAELGAEDDSLVDALSEAILDEGTGPHEPYPGTEILISGLAERFDFSIVTNGHPDIQRRKVVKSGLRDRFNVVVASGDPGVETKKPDPKPFQQALGELNVTAREAMMIGDNPVNDIAGAAQLGMQTVWVNRSGEAFSGPIKPDHEVSDLSELRRILAGGS